MNFPFKISLISIGLKLLVLTIITISAYIFSYPGSELSETESIVIDMTDDQEDMIFWYVPKKIDHFGEFSQATSGLWFKSIDQKNGQLYLKDVYLPLLDISSKNLNGDILYWEVKRLENNKYILSKNNSSETKVTVIDYCLYHSWRLILIATIFFLISWGIDHYYHLKSGIVSSIIIFSAYLFYLGSIFLY